MIRNTAVDSVSVVAGTFLFVRGLLDVDQRALDDLGLMASLPLTSLLGAVLLVGGAAGSIARTPISNVRSFVHVGAFVVVLSSTAPIAYGTLRYSWAFKHTGIVDYILRTGEVDPDIHILPVYHNWPGFFAGAASLADLSGGPELQTLAMWTPVVLNVLTMLALRFVFRQFLVNDQTAWFAVLIFMATNWIGQDYFAPQALAFFLYLATLGLLLHTYGRLRQTAPSAAILAVLFLFSLAIAISHQLTPIILVVAILGFMLTRQAEGSLPFLALATALAGWLLGGALPFVRENLRDELGRIGSPVEATTSTFTRAAVRNDAQEIVALVGRGVLLLLVVLAAVGGFRRLRSRRDNLAPFVLMAAPLSVVVMDFGGEIVFRIVLFMLPMLSLLAAEAILAVRIRLLRATAMVVIPIVLAGAMMLVSFGKDAFYTFSEDEIALVTDLMDRAPNNSLLIEGSRNYPSQFLEYEKFTYVAIARESDQTQERLLANPEDELHRWLSNDGYNQAYLLITRSQQREAEAIGSLQVDFLETIEQALRSDDRFAVFSENDDAIAFVVAP